MDGIPSHPSWNPRSPISPLSVSLCVCVCVCVSYLALIPPPKYRVDQKVSSGFPIWCMFGKNPNEHSGQSSISLDNPFLQSHSPSLPGEPLSHPTHMAISFSPPSTGEPEDHLRGLKQSHITIQASRGRKEPPSRSNVPAAEKTAQEHICITAMMILTLCQFMHSMHLSMPTWPFYSNSNRARENHSSDSYLSCLSFSCFSKTGEKWWPWRLCEI